MTIKYMEIGETGQRTDVKWATLTNNDGKGLMIVGNPRMEFSAQHYTPEQLSNVKLPWELLLSGYGPRNGEPESALLRNRR